MTFGLPPLLIGLALLSAACPLDAQQTKSTRRTTEIFALRGDSLFSYRTTTDYKTSRLDSSVTRVDSTVWKVRRDTVAVPVDTAPRPDSIIASGGFGVPFGPFGGIGMFGFSASIDPYTADSVIPRIRRAKIAGKRIMLQPVSGSHSRYITSGKFDLNKWRARLQEYNRADIRAEVAKGVKDSTVLGAEVQDEPQHESWGGRMTKALVDSMCAYVKEVFPTLPVGPTHDASAFEPTKDYKVCDFIISQYRWHKTKGDIARFRDIGLALARRSNHAIAFSMNYQDGGRPRTPSGTCSLSTTGGPSPREALSCRMHPDQIFEWGKVLGPAGCALFMWHDDAISLLRPENQRSYRELGAYLAGFPSKPCRRTG